MSKSLVDVTNILTPFLTHLKEMEVELKCPICSSLLNDPKLLPCDHIFCRHCIVADAKIGSCFVCQKTYNCKDLVSAIIIQKMVTIFNEMDDAIGSIFLKNGSEVDSSDTGPKGVQDISTKMLGIDIGKSNTMRPHDPCAGYKYTSNLKDVKIEEFSTAGLNRFVRDTGDEERVNQMVVSSPLHPARNKAIEEANSDQVNEPRKNIFMPMYPRKKGFNAEIEMETDVKSLSAKRFSDVTQDSRLANTENTKSVSRSQEDCNPEPKRQKRGSTSGRPLRIKRMDAPIECAFCHSFRTTEGSGPMEHYLNGKEVTGEEAYKPKVIHVHKKCLLWAPRAYFKDDDTVVGLQKELSRASKLKCDKCGLKGAALGCYVKHCSKSFHVPCAYQIPTCRWVNYDLFCPSHASEVSPCDEPKSTNKINSKDSTSAQRGGSNALPTHYNGVSTPGFHAERRWVLCGSDLSVSEDELVRKFAYSIGATVTELWDQKVTHVIASTDKDGACSRTFKVLMAILNGKWVVTTAWVKDYVEAKHRVAEERYEVGLDYYGVVDGPKKGRLRVMEKAPKLFAGLQFSFTGDFKGKGNVEKLILAAGGTILKKTDWLSKHDTNIRGSSPTSYVVYADEPPEVVEEPPEIRDLVDPDKVLRRRIQKAEDLAAKTGSRVISHKWISDAIAASSLECS